MLRCDRHKSTTAGAGRHGQRVAQRHSDGTRLPAGGEQAWQGRHAPAYDRLQSHRRPDSMVSGNSAVGQWGRQAASTSRAWPKC
jgi:hypothetical protein